MHIRLELIGREELRERLENAWLIQAPKLLAAQFLGEDPPESWKSFSAACALAIADVA